MRNVRREHKRTDDDNLSFDTTACLKDSQRLFHVPIKLVVLR